MDYQQGRYLDEIHNDYRLFSPGRKVTVYQHYYDMIDNWFIIIINNQLGIMERYVCAVNFFNQSRYRSSETLFSENVDTPVWTQALLSCYLRQDLRCEL
jgi:hypothetical protein